MITGAAVQPAAPAEMKPEDPMQSDQALRQLLHEWKLESSLPPRFQEQVWQRIERQEVPVQVPGWVMLWQRFSAALTRPTPAIGYVTVLLLAGVLAGYWEARVTRAQVDEQMGARYVQLVSSFQNPHR
jgi:hypothetical protein